MKHGLEPNSILQTDDADAKATSQIRIVAALSVISDERVILNAKAMEWFRKSAAMESAGGQYGIGYLYQNGWGVERDFARALEWFRKAADYDDGSAQSSIGWMYHNGQGVPSLKAQGLLASTAWTIRRRLSALANSSRPSAKHATVTSWRLARCRT